jgi:hypothetical protein
LYGWVLVGGIGFGVYLYTSKKAAEERKGYQKKIVEEEKKLQKTESEYLKKKDASKKGDDWK